MQISSNDIQSNSIIRYNIFIFGQLQVMVSILVIYKEMDYTKLEGKRNSLKRMELIIPALQSLCLVSVSFVIIAGVINRERD